LQPNSLEKSEKGGIVSKLLDNLSLAFRGSAPPLGFRRVKATSKSPRMILIATLPVDDAPAAALAKEYADAVLLSDTKGTKLPDKFTASLGELPWGVSIGEATDEQIVDLKEAGCDFLVCDTEKAPLMLLREEEIGRIVKLEPSLPDGLTRVTAQLPIDAVLIGGDPFPSVQRLMICQHMVNLVRMPLVAPVPLDIAGEDLEELWETGMAGIVVTVAGDSKERLAVLRTEIENLPISRRRTSDKSEAFLPYLGEEEIIDEDEEE
jgi:hypothetical protein